MEITAINIQGTVRRISSSTMTMSTYNSVIPYLLWERVPENSWIVCPRYGKKPYDIQLALPVPAGTMNLQRKRCQEKFKKSQDWYLPVLPIYSTKRPEVLKIGCGVFVMRTIAEHREVSKISHLVEETTE